MTVEQTKIVVKSQKCSMSAERKSAGEQRRSVPKNSRAFSACQKKQSMAAS